MATGQGETDPCPTAVGTQVVSSASSAVAQSELFNLLKQRLPESAGGPSSQVTPALPPAGPMQGPLQGWGGGVFWTRAWPQTTLLLFLQLGPLLATILEPGQTEAQALGWPP